MLTVSAWMTLEANLLYKRFELVLYAIVIAVSFGVGLMTERLEHRLQTKTLASEIAEKNQTYAFGIEAEISKLVAWASGMAAAVALKPNMDQREFSAAAARLGTNSSIVLNISRATEDIVQNVFPVARNLPLLGKDLSAIPNQSDGVELARRTGKPTFIGPIDLVQGGRGFILRLGFSATSIYSSPSSRREMISIAVDSEKFFGRIAADAAKSGLRTAVLRVDDGEVIYGDPTVLDQQPVLNSFETPSSTWTIASAPEAGWPLVSSSAAAIAALVLFRTLVVCAVLRAIFRMLRKQRVAEERLSVAIEALDDGFAIFDAEDRLVLFNSRYREFYKTSADYLVSGARFEEIIRGGVMRGQYPDAKGQEKQWIDQRLALHRSGSSAFEQRLDDGRWLRVVERRTEDGSIVSFRVDITDLKMATEAARSAARAKSEFISLLNHELRTPLTIVIGYVGLMAEISKHPLVADLQKAIAAGSTSSAESGLIKLVETAEDMASKANRSAHQLLSLINHLLDFSKIEAGKMRVDAVDLEVATILDDIERSLREMVEGKGLEFQVYGTPATVHADPIRVRQILTNLMSNALKFTKSGFIRVEASKQAKTVLFKVQDSGCGIPSEMAGTIFSRFEQADSSSARRAGGTGLGLSISRSLAELMDGEIGFESSVQSGSTFWFTVPLAVSGVLSSEAIADSTRP
ncbi:MAG: ATP-binding protein [Gemmobacter sp.]